MDLENTLNISDNFNDKLKNIFKHYIAPTEIDEEKNGLFKNTLDYLTTEDIEILLYSYAQKHQFNPNYDLSNIKLVDNDIHFSQLKTYLDSQPIHKQNENIKLFLKVKKGEPPCWGVHVVPVYIRHEGKVLSAFIHDAAFGIMYETKDGFTEATRVIEEYLKIESEKLNVDYRIIKSSAILMADARNCPIYGLLAIRYFIKFGHILFDQLDSFLIKQEHKVCDQFNNQIYHVSADGLPAQLYKYANRRTLERMNAMYNHEWMPEKISLTENYQTYPSNDLLHYKLPAFLGKSYGLNKMQTLESKLMAHSGQKKSRNSEQYFMYNFFADRKMDKARTTILQKLTESKVIEQVSENSSAVNQHKLEKLVLKIRK